MFTIKINIIAQIKYQVRDIIMYQKLLLQKLVFIITGLMICI